MESSKLSPAEQKMIRGEFLGKEAEIMRQKRRKYKAKDFEPIKIIGRGAFGEVRLCRFKESGEILAVKKMKKSEMEFKNQTEHVQQERDALVSANGGAMNPWIIQLKFSFQDPRHLYLAMEYLPGGDLMTLLMKKDILSEEESKFYMAEMILAVHSVHSIKYIHRDLKPDNVLIDQKGHIKLSDFGLCKFYEVSPGRFALGAKKNEETPANKHPVLKNIAPKTHKVPFSPLSRLIPLHLPPSFHFLREFTRLLGHQTTLPLRSSVKTGTMKLSIGGHLESFSMKCWWATPLSSQKTLQ
jgi:serine/threonine kinase 38